MTYTNLYEKLVDPCVITVHMDTTKTIACTFNTVFSPLRPDISSW